MMATDQNALTIVTGAAGALGSCVARELVEAGYKVCAIDISPVPEVAGMMSRTGVDLTNYDSVKTTIESILQEAGPVSNLVNIAGGFAWETLTEGSVDTWNRMWAMNLQTALNMSMASLESLKATGGSVINIGAAAAARADLGMGAYTASKAAVVKLTETLSKELKPSGGRANAILPSIIDTPGNREGMPDADTSDWVPPEDIAVLVKFLLSGSARCISGALIPITYGA